MHKSNQYTKPHRQSGFSLLEIMVAVAIIGIMAATVGVKLFGNIEKANITKAKQDIADYSGALKILRVDTFSYPSTSQGLDALVSQPGGSEVANWNGPYLDKLKKDPWGRDYQYVSPGQHGDFDLYSLGKDGRPGGEGVNADVTSWE